MNQPFAASAGNARSVPVATTQSPYYRWGQLIMGIFCMAMIANLQYGWTLFVNPIADKHGWSRATIQVAFTTFVLTEIWLVPIEGFLEDRELRMRLAELEFKSAKAD